ncbi:GGDEF domain-containing protein [Qipengyuania qiaonensis]|uniref:diguanylate cyclase n=1 Tax=Qipengyuania qiaonensis TaxID=2867240 RepID=A0ABS7J3M3_9SPHN|nr:GGDEF domain-containing protein [Qipengyuania qiaonensis]MBX7481929.1 GGDEF domain-containing protein [Qipengyuania qiaonensis]
MDPAQDFDLARAAHAALVGNHPVSAWDKELRNTVEQALAETHHREGRFVLLLTLPVAVLSLITDLLVAPGHLGEIAAVRLGLVVPLASVALLLPRQMLWLQKLLIAFSLTGFAFSMAFASLFVPSPSDAMLALGVVTLLALALPVLPFRGWALIGFVLLYLSVIGSFFLMNRGDVIQSNAFIAIMILAAGTATAIAHRVHWLERRNLLLTIEAGSRAATLEGSNARLIELSMEDPLTGLANRRRTKTVFAEHYAKTATAGRGDTALFMLDLDHFKAFNDRWGHQAGDSCLRAVAEVMRHTANRHGGLAARFGGEEFVILLNADDAAQAHAIAEDLRIAIERIEIEHNAGASTATCTASIGIALHQGPDTPVLEEMLSRADSALYRAKAEGRNRCSVAA